nr:hypothetical protein GCM10020093_092610 [Planobispora longispora]
MAGRPAAEARPAADRLRRGAGAARGGRGRGRYLYERSREPLPPPDAPLSAQMRIVAHLCGQRVEAWTCPDMGEVTDAEGRAIAEHMRAMPELEDVAFVSKEEDGRRALAYYTAIGEPERADELFFHASVEAVLRRGGDFEKVAARLRESPGVVAVLRELPDVWAGKADLAVALCVEGSGWRGDAGRAGRPEPGSRRPRGRRRRFSTGCGTCPASRRSTCRAGRTSCGSSGSTSRRTRPSTCLSGRSAHARPST